MPAASSSLGRTEPPAPRADGAWRWHKVVRCSLPWHCKEWWKTFIWVGNCPKTTPAGCWRWLQDGTGPTWQRGGEAKGEGGGHSPAAQLRTDLSPWEITCLRGLNIKIKANFNSTKKRGEKKAELQFKELKSGWKIQSSFLPLQEHR